MNKTLLSSQISSLCCWLIITMFVYCVENNQQLQVTDHFPIGHILYKYGIATILPNHRKHLLSLSANKCTSSQDFTQIRPRNLPSRLDQISKNDRVVHTSKSSVSLFTSISYVYLSQVYLLCISKSSVSLLTV